MFLIQENPTARLPLLPETGVRHTATADRPKLSHRLSQSQLKFDATLIRPKEVRGLRQSKSYSIFAHQLSHKLSSTFGNPTIVHRPNVRTRPALLPMHENPSPVAGIQSDQELSPGSTAPSSFNYSGSVSAGDPSIGKTSLESSVTSLRPVIAPDLNDKPSDSKIVTAAKEIVREKPLTPI